MAKVKVRIAVAVAPNGFWNAVGWRGADDALAMRAAWEGRTAVRYWLEAELDVPQETVVQAVVTKDGEP